MAEIQPVKASTVQKVKAKPKPESKYDKNWVKAKAVCRLNQEDIAMVKKLGIKPLALIRNNPTPQQRWKAPVKVWIHDLYEKRFGRQNQKKKEQGNGL